LGHLACPVLIRNSFILKLFSRRIEMEDLVEAVSAWLDLQRVREKDEDRDGKLSDGDEDRGRRVHCDDVRAHLDDILNEKVN
jgi:hypothetical protein